MCPELVEFKISYVDWGTSFFAAGVVVWWPNSLSELWNRNGRPRSVLSYTDTIAGPPQGFVTRTRQWYDKKFKHPPTSAGIRSLNCFVICQHLEFATPDNSETHKKWLIASNFPCPETWFFGGLAVLPKTEIGALLIDCEHVGYATPVHKLSSITSVPMQYSWPGAISCNRDSCTTLTRCYNN